MAQHVELRNTLCHNIGMNNLRQRVSEHLGFLAERQELSRFCRDNGLKYRTAMKVKDVSKSIRRETLEFWARRAGVYIEGGER